MKGPWAVLNETGGGGGGSRGRKRGWVAYSQGAILFNWVTVGHKIKNEEVLRIHWGPFYLTRSRRDTRSKTRLDCAREKEEEED